MSHNFEQSANSMACATVPIGAALPGRANILGWGRQTSRQRLNREMTVRLDERRRERTRIARDLHDTLLQGFLGVSLMLDSVAEEMPIDSPSKASLSRALNLMRRVIDEGRSTLQGLRSPQAASTTLEQSLSEFGEEVSAVGPRFRLSVSGPSPALSQVVQEQLHLIAREALVNALRHSRATNIEAEIEYLPQEVRVVVRDNGSGIDQDELTAKQDSHWGLLGMRERAATIGARLRIWSRTGAGTEVEISLPLRYRPEGVGLNSEAIADL